jgi:hypothetical protein
MWESIGETRIDFKENTWERNRLITNNVDDLKSVHPSDGIINNAVFDTIEEEYYQSQYTIPRTKNTILSIAHKQGNMISTILIKTFTMLKITHRPILKEKQR